MKFWYFMCKTHGFTMAEPGPDEQCLWSALGLKRGEPLPSVANRYVMVVKHKQSAHKSIRFFSSIWQVQELVPHKSSRKIFVAAYAVGPESEAVAYPEAPANWYTKTLVQLAHA